MTSTQLRPMPFGVLVHFTRLSSSVSIYTPPSSTAQSTIAPTTILFMAWVDAKPKHIEKYISQYMNLFPSAQIILITISLYEFLWQTEAARRAAVKPAVQALLANSNTSAGGEDRILVHAFSNGGVKRLYGVANIYKQLTNAPFPVKTIIMDSSPGIPRFRRDVHILMQGAPRNPILYYASYLIAGFVAALIFLVIKSPFHKELVWNVRDGMQNENLLNEKAYRCYVYSKRDRAIDWRDIEAHAEEGERKGLAVEKHVFDAEHVELMRVDGERYWSIVRGAWRKGMGL